MTPTAVNLLLGIITAAIPEGAALIQALIAFRKKYPALTADQINALVATVTGQADTAFDDVLAKIAADQAAHPPA